MRGKLAITNQTNSKGFRNEMDLHFLVLDIIFPAMTSYQILYIFLPIVYIRNIDAAKEAIGSTWGS